MKKGDIVIVRRRIYSRVVWFEAKVRGVVECWAVLSRRGAAPFLERIGELKMWAIAAADQGVDVEPYHRKGD